MATKSKYPVTPKGELLWAHLTTPDTTFKAEGQYHVKLILRGEQADELKSSIDQAHAAWKSSNSGKSFKEYMPYQPNKDKDGVEDGMQFHFKMKASGTNSKTGEKYTQKPIIVGPDKRPVPSTVKIGNGSVAKIAYELAPYAQMSSLGVQLRLRGVQVLKLIEYLEEGGDFFDEEEGYELNLNESTEETEDSFEEEEEEHESGDF